MAEETTQQPEMTLDDAINIVNGRRHNSALIQAEIFFTKQIESVHLLSLEEKGMMYFYLLRCKLERNVLYETPDMVHLYKKMHESFSAAEEDYKKNLRKSPNKNIADMQLTAFYRIMGFHYGSLEQIYKHHNFTDSARLAFEDNMHYRKNYFFHTKQFVRWLGYKIYEITSNYGNSFLRWGLTGVIAVVAFATMFVFIDASTSAGLRMIDTTGSFYDYFYYSIVTFTTLGYGDITPVTGLHKFFAGVEVVFGYFMLGMFINLMNKKL
jgi:hypothetical protein